ncbi:MAG: hypothetical protein WAK29_13290 [Terriglobales bacterium]
MKLTSLFSASALTLLLGATALLYAQERHDEDAKPQEESRPEASTPAQDENKMSRPDAANPQKQDQDRDKDKSEPAEDKAGKKNDAKAAKQEGQQNQHAQRASNQGRGHIPDDKFRAHFGRQHTFAIKHVNTVGGQPQFQYGGYSFTIVDAWPMGWAYTDQCYIDYIDGEYFLFDLLHPGVQLALVVVS